VDDAGAAQEGLPLRRRVPLSTPAGDISFMRVAASVPPRSPSMLSSIGRHFASSQKQPATADLADMIRSIADTIDWDTQGPPLAQGDTAKLPARTAADLANLIKVTGLLRLARSYGADPLHLAILLMAWCASQSGDRAATRVFKVLEKEIGPRSIAGITASFGLD
jgi:hypothetical protein